MNLKKISDIELTNRLDKLVRSERKITHLILEHIVEFESRRLYSEKGYENMFAYLTKKLGYGEDSAYRRLKAARVVKRIPEVAVKIENGVLNLTQLSQVEKCLKADNTQGIVRSTNETHQILEKIENCSGYETKKILAVEFNQPLQVQTHIIPQKDDSVRLEITLNQEQFKELKTAQSLLSHICHSSDLAEVIATLALKFNQSKLGKNNHLKEDSLKTNKIKKNNLKNIETPRPKMTSAENVSKELLNMSEIQKTQTDSVKTHQQEQTILTESMQVTQSFLGAQKSRKSKRKYILIQTRRSLLKLAAYSCEYINDNVERCGSQYQLQIEHINPIALGGTDSIENLKILCRTHNVLEARRLGIMNVKKAPNISEF